ncbi:MAG TPA: radical SAM protein [Anaerovoracaceae bacterium]|nr:radical SAM protein [Anaerovoracaceae bacterium]
MKDYLGFEIGPIRPPSEAESLLVRVTRNCPWNKCEFCTIYKGERFSLRDKEHVINDINIVKDAIVVLSNKGYSFAEANDKLDEIREKAGENGDFAISSAMTIYRMGVKSVFLQDADTMIAKPDDLVEIIKHIREVFPTVERVTSYGRSSTISRISDKDMKRIAEAGLNRIHMGMESGSNKVLELINKGTTKEKHIAAGKKVVEVGMDLSVYYMPGLGGKEFSEENAIETADAINMINPSYVRIRTLAVSENSLLNEKYLDGTFTRTNDTDMVIELKMMIENLEGIDSNIVSDHIINLIPEVNGKMPKDKNKMIDAIDWYLNLSDEDKIIYRIGRRTGIMYDSEAFNSEALKNKIIGIMRKEGIDKNNIDYVTDNLINRYI